MTTSHNGNGDERIKEELRRLKRRGAPWYFESALHQRLHGGRKRRPHLRPIPFTPVLAVAVVTLCLLALASYAVLMHTNLFSGPGRPAPADSVAHPAEPPEPAAPAAAAGKGKAEPRPPVRLRPSGTADTSSDRTPDRKSVRDDSTGVRTAHRPARIDSALVRRDSAGAPRDSSAHRIDTSGRAPVSRPPG